MAVDQILTSLAIDTISVQMGAIETRKDLDSDALKDLNIQLRKMGFEILEDQVAQKIERIKNIIIQKISELDIEEDFLLSNFIVHHMHSDYSALSKSFSQNKGITLEQYFILQKIEKVKELLIYDEYSLSEISIMLGYKSVQHLSTQFKNVTGFTPTAFKKLEQVVRKPLDLI